jgi:cleavage stimulation factor subunit 2
LITTQPEEARQLLTKKPQLAYALFQAMLLMNIVDPSVLQRIQPLAPSNAAPVAPAQQYPPAGNAYPPYPPQQQQQQQPPAGGYPPYPAAGNANANFRPPAGGAAYNAPQPPAPAPPAQAYGGYPAAQPAAPAPAPAPAAPASLPPATQAALNTLPEDQRVGQAPTKSC